MTLLLGGARSGKSTLALRLATESGGSVGVVATATASDGEMTVRIANHRAERPPAWRTFELPTRVGEGIASEPDVPDVLILDCITLLASNVLLALPEPVDGEVAEAAVDAEIDALLHAYRRGSSHWIVVSNEVGLGLVPPYPLGRVYRDALGRANQRLAAEADEVLLLVAGLPMRLKG
jgi:adenosylcobinamide kinase/adenosylcobinamide-phosphate guanylyltransferase